MSWDSSDKVKYLILDVGVCAVKGSLIIGIFTFWRKDKENEFFKEKQ